MAPQLEEEIVIRDFNQVRWDEYLIDDCRQIVRLAVREDLDRHYDWTTVAMIPPGREGHTAVVVARMASLPGWRRRSWRWTKWMCKSGGMRPSRTVMS